MNNKFQEDEITELKKSTSELKEAIISIVSILNKHRHGKLYFGIKDDGTVIGQEVSGKTLRYISEVISNKIEPKIYPQINNVKIEDKDCILVEFEGEDVPYFADGRAYIRVSDRDQKLSISEMRKIFLKTENESGSWDSRVSDRTIEDVNEDILKNYIARANKAKRIPFQYTNKEDVLNKLGLLKNNKLLNAGKVLFCDNSNVELQMAIFATDTKTTFIDIDKVEGNIFDLIKIGQEYIRKNIIWNVKITDKREEYPEIPLDSIREAIINSYAHRLYRDPKGTEISIFKNKVEIYNPGTFPEQYTPEDYIQNRAHSVFRNPIIANILYKSSDTETYSSGIRRIYEECTSNNVKVEFRKEKIGFTIIFYRKNYEKENEIIKNVGVNVGVNAGVNSTQRKILELIEQNQNITQKEIASKLKTTVRTIERNMNILKEKDILKRVGTDKVGYWEIIPNKEN